MQNCSNSYNQVCKITINWNKYLARKSKERQNSYLDYWIDPSFQGLNRLFVLSFENDAVRIGHTGYFLPKVEKHCHVMIDEQDFFDQTKNDMITFKKLRQVKEMIIQLIGY